MAYKYAVVTRVSEDEGNWITALGGGIQVPDPDGGFMPVDAITSLGWRVPAFHEGELLVLDGDREAIGLYRNPSKFDVGIDVFDNVEDAIARAVEVGEEARAALL